MLYRPNMQGITSPVSSTVATPSTPSVGTPIGMRPPMTAPMNAKPFVRSPGAVAGNVMPNQNLQNIPLTMAEQMKSTAPVKADQSNLNNSNSALAQAWMRLSPEQIQILLQAHAASAGKGQPPRFLLHLQRRWLHEFRLTQ